MSVWVDWVTRTHNEVRTPVAGRHRYRVKPGAGIMEADDRQVTTVFTVQPSFHHRHSTNRVS